MSISNENRASIGEAMTAVAGVLTGVGRNDTAETAAIDAGAYLCHYADRLGLDPQTVLAMAYRSYKGQREEGEAVQTVQDSEEPILTPRLGD